MIDWHGHYAKHHVWERGHKNQQTDHPMTLPKGLPGKVVEDNATSKYVSHQLLSHSTKRINQGQELFFEYGSEFWKVSSYA